MLDDFSLKSWLYASGAETHSLHRGMQNSGDASQRLIAALQHVDPTAAVPSPRVVLVGSQSSGKSSLVNALIGLPLLPTSEEMCTKVPLYLHISPSDQGEGGGCSATLSVGESVLLDWRFDWHCWRGEEGVARVQAAIQAASDDLVSREDGASDAAERRLHLSLRLPRCPEMSLVDLPGLTACDRTDVHGRAASSERLRRIAVEMASPQETVVVAVMAARVDVEVDLAWQVLKEVDAEGSRTAIVLTKPDLVVPSSSFRRVLLENGGGNIAARLGYHVAMLKDFFKEGDDASGQREARFFNEHNGYAALKTEMPSRFGVAEVRRRLGGVGHRLVVEHLPRIIETLRGHQATLEERLGDLGEEDDLALQNPVAWLSHAVRGVVALLRESLRGRNSLHVAAGGTPIAASLARLRGGVLSLQPLAEREGSAATEGSTHRGIHLPEVSLVALLENLMRVSSTRDHMALVETCLGEISRVVTEASDYACHHLFSRHRGALASRVREIVVERCAAASARCQQEARQMLEAEVGNVWCDTPAFRSAFSGGESEAAVEAYQADLLSHTSHYLPRILLHGMTTRLLDDLEVAVVEGMLSPEVLADEASLRELVSEGSEVAEARREVRHQLEAAQKALMLVRQVTPTG